jgi:hypothetical protein
MNERGVEELMAAGLAGRRQITGRLHDPDTDGVCALGALGVRPEMTYEQVGKIEDLCGVSRTAKRSCPECGLISTEEQIIVHLNDVHRQDFISIARKLGPDAA